MDMSHVKKQDIFCKYFASIGVLLEARATAIGQDMCWPRVPVSCGWILLLPEDIPGS